MAPSTTLLDLPSELILNILQPLPLYDCSLLVKAFPNPKIRACYNTRSSIRDYLSQRGLPRADFVAALNASDVLILGGLATEYFTPGSSKSDSKWVFLVPGDRGKRYHFMKYMESCGMRWCSLHEDLVYSQSQAGKFTMRRSHFCRAALSSQDSSLRLSGDKFWHSSEPTVRALRGPSGWNYHLSRETQAKWDAVQGHIGAKDGTEQVAELIYAVSEETSMYAYLERIRSSAAQCFITGAGALHMYPALASRKDHHVWSSRRESGAAQLAEDLNLRELRRIILPMFRQRAPGESRRVGPACAEDLIQVRRDSSDSQALFVPIDSVSDSEAENDNAAIAKWCRLVWRQYQRRI